MVSPNVTELQEPTYTPEVVQVIQTASTTQPAEETATSTEEKVEHEDVSPSVLCNCYRYVKERIPDLPHTSVILSNLESEGEVAVFYYPSSGVHHYAVVKEVTPYAIVIQEANFKSCQYTQRVLPRDYPRLLGFYSVS